MTRIRKLGALALATPLAMGFTILDAPLSAQAAASGITSPSSGAVISHGSTVTVSATAPLFGGTLYVYPPVGASVRVDSGGPWTKLSGSVPIGRNGPYRVELQGIGGDHQTFYVRVPPSAPGGLSATVSGKKLTVRWNLGLEDDLNGYSITAGGTSRSIGTSCPGSTCSTSFSIPSNATGTVNIGVQARRSNGSGGTLVSGTSRTSVTVGGGSGGTGNTGGNTTPNFPNYSNKTPLTPINPNSGLNLPTVAPDGSNPGFVYPTPAPEVATQNQVTPKAKPVAEVNQMAWGRSLALALILLVCAAHLGTWTRRLRFAQAGSVIGGRLARKGAGKARVKTAHERIAQAEALAKTGTLTKADVLGKAAARDAAGDAAQSPQLAGPGKAGKQTKPTGRRSGKSRRRSNSKVASTASQAPAATPPAKDQVDEAIAALTSLATETITGTTGLAGETEDRTGPGMSTPTIAESAARSHSSVPPIQPLDRAAIATGPLGEITEWDGQDEPAVETLATEDRSPATSRTPRGRRRRRTK